MATTVCSWFVRWVIGETQIEIVHHNDPPWDHSGEARRYHADSLMLLGRYISLDNWLTAEYIGQSTAAFVSGMGLFWETYEDKFEEEIQQTVYQVMEEHWLKSRNYPDDFDVWEDPVWDELSGVEITLQQALRLYVGRMLTADAWNQLEDIVRAQMEDEQRQSEVYCARSSRTYS
jgi:hypothetical protein